MYIHYFDQYQDSHLGKTVSLRLKKNKAWTFEAVSSN